MTTGSPARYLLCILLLLLAILMGLLFTGVRDMYAFNRLTLSDDFSLSGIVFHTRQSLRRAVVRFGASSLPEASQLPSFHLYSSDKTLAVLNENLPDSGKSRYVQAHLTSDSPEMSSKVNFRYRGNIPLHWLHKKKSLRIKLPDFTNYLGLQTFNLVNPSTIATITDWLSYNMSRELGLLSPDYFPARVFLNNEFNGLHFFLGQADESLLRKSGRMPGNIYSGENQVLENPFGENLGINARVFVDSKGESLIWTDYRLWEKRADRNSESREDRRDIEKFVSIVNLEDPLEFLWNFQTYFDAGKYFRFWALDTIVGSYHHDLYHNQKMYFDPYRGRFEPIQWDVRFWGALPQLPLTPLLKQVKLNPVLSFQLDQTIFRLLNEYSVEDIHRRIRDADAVIAPELAADPHRQKTGDPMAGGHIQTVVPFSMEEYRGAIGELENGYQVQHKRIQDLLDASAAAYVVIPVDSHTFQLVVAVNGNSPVRFSPWQLIPEKQHEQVKIFKFAGGRELNVEAGEPPEILYPGKKIVPGNALGKDTEWANIAFGKSRLVHSPLLYTYVFTHSDGIDISLAKELVLQNAVTGSDVVLAAANNLASASETDSVHPWSLQSASPEPVAPIVLSGIMDVDKDMVFPEGQTVIISPGTTFRLAKSVSVVFYGKVLANGTADRTIKFQQKTPGEPWGSIIIKGEKATGSRLSHLFVSGGSVSTQRLIDYPGELNIHELDNFELNHCVIANNHVGDDALHVAYSSGSIAHCHFENTAYDALDMDLVDVDISSSTFLDIGNDAIDIMSSRTRVHNVTVNNTGDKCLSVGENSSMELGNSVLNNCLIGIAVKDQSRAMLENVAFSNNREVAIALYRKNPRYSGGGTISGRQLSGISEKDIQADEHSVSNIPANEFLPAMTAAPGKVITSN